MDSSEARTENDSWNFRSPCLDAHHEAFILRSSWTVGNLYAANLHLGQSYVKQVKDLEKQRKVWLSRKEKEQETMLRRWKALEKQARNSHSSDGSSEVKDVRRPASPTVRKFRQRATTVVMDIKAHQKPSHDPCMKLTGNSSLFFLVSCVMIATTS